jgi:GNAT superfamily N-acetyltransferase
MPPNLTLHWITSPTAKAITARAIAEIMVSDPAYICRDEYTDGFSADGRTWNKDAAEALTGFFLNDPEMQNRLFVQASDKTNAFLGGVVIEPSHNGHEKYWTIEDLVVTPAARRHGVGEALLNFLMHQARKTGVARLMLESGVSNSGAHTLFTNKGFAPISTLYALDIIENKTKYQ